MFILLLFRMIFVFSNSCNEVKSLFFCFSSIPGLKALLLLAVFASNIFAYIFLYPVFRFIKDRVAPILSVSSMLHHPWNWGPPLVLTCLVILKKLIPSTSTLPYHLWTCVCTLSWCPCVDAEEKNDIGVVVLVLSCTFLTILLCAGTFHVMLFVAVYCLDSLCLCFLELCVLVTVLFFLSSKKSACYSGA